MPADKKTYQREYAATHRAKINARRKMWREKNRDEIHTKLKEYRRTEKGRALVKRSNKLAKARKKLRRANRATGALPVHGARFVANEIRRLRALGKDEITIAIRMGITVSSVRQLLEKQK